MSIAYSLDPATGLRYGAATVSWTAQTLNDTGLATIGVATWQVWVSTDGGSNFTQVTSVTGDQTSAVLPRYRAGTVLTIGVVAVSYDGVSSDMSATIDVTIAVDTALPPTPSHVTVASKAGGISVTIDGKDNGGTALPASVAHVVVEMSTSSTFSTGVLQVASLLPVAGVAQVAPSQVTYGTTYYFRSKAVGVEGQQSSYSTTQSVAASTIASTDLDPTLASTISTASSNASSALTAANGKNKNTRSTANPSGSGTAVGDKWFKMSTLAVGGVVLGQWSWDGSSWVSETLGSAVISSLDAGVITTGTLVADRIGAGTLTADLISFGSLDNLVENPQFKHDLTGWNAPANMTIVTGHSRTSGAKSLKIAHVNGTRDTLVNEIDWDVLGGEYYKVSAWIYPTVAIGVFQMSLGTVWNKTDGTFGYYDSQTFGPGLTTNAWNHVEEFVPVPTTEDATTAHFRLYVDTACPTGTVYVDSVACTRVVDESMLNMPNHNADIGMPYGALTKATGVTLSSTTTFSEQTFDTLGKTTNDMTFTSGRLVVPTDGTYDVRVSLVYAASTTGDRGLGVAINGVVTSQGAVSQNGTAAPCRMATSVCLDLSAGDTLSIATFQTSGSSTVAPTGLKITAFKLPVN